MSTQRGGGVFRRSIGCRELRNTPREEATCEGRRVHSCQFWEAPWSSSTANQVRQSATITTSDPCLLVNHILRLSWSLPGFKRMIPYWVYLVFSREPPTTGKEYPRDISRLYMYPRLVYHDLAYHRHGPCNN